MTPFEKWNVFKPTVQKESDFVKSSRFLSEIHLRMEKRSSYEFVSTVFVWPIEREIVCVKADILYIH